MSEPTSEQPVSARGSNPDDVSAAGVTDESAHNLTVEDDPGGTTDPGDLAGTGDAGDDAVE